MNNCILVAENLWKSAIPLRKNKTIYYIKIGWRQRNDGVCLQPVCFLYHNHRLVVRLPQRGHIVTAAWAHHYRIARIRFPRRGNERCREFDAFSWRVWFYILQLQFIKTKCAIVSRAAVFSRMSFFAEVFKRIFAWLTGRLRQKILSPNDGCTDKNPYFCILKYRTWQKWTYHKTSNNKYVRSSATICTIGSRRRSTTTTRPVVRSRPYTPSRSFGSRRSVRQW